MNRMNERSKIGHQILEAVKHYDIQILKTRLVSRTAYADTATDGIGVVEGKDAKAKEEFNRFTDEIEKIISQTSIPNAAWVKIQYYLKRRK